MVNSKDDDLLACLRRNPSVPCCDSFLLRMSVLFSSASSTTDLSDLLCRSPRDYGRGRTRRQSVSVAFVLRGQSVTETDRALCIGGCVHAVFLAVHVHPTSLVHCSTRVLSAAVRPGLPPESSVREGPPASHSAIDPLAVGTDNLLHRRLTAVLQAAFVGYLEEQDRALHTVLSFH